MEFALEVHQSLLKLRYASHVSVRRVKQSALDSKTGAMVQLMKQYFSVYCPDHFGNLDTVTLISCASIDKG